MIDLSEIYPRIRRLQQAVSRKPDLRWAVVVSVLPTSIRLDGDEAALLGAPSTTVHGLRPGDRVLVALHNRRVTILGRGGKQSWSTLPRSSGISIYAGQTPRMTVRGGELILEGALTPTSGSFGTSYTTLIPAGGIPDLSGVRDGYRSVRLLSSAGGTAPLRSFIDESGSLQVSTTSGTASYVLLNSRYLIDS